MIRKRSWGPGMLVTAAFIGPGTVTLASKSGAADGYGLLWVVGLSVIAAIVFQEMAARLGIVTGQDLAQSLRLGSTRRWFTIPAILLVVLAVLIGNAAYQAGNIAGATTGLSVLSGISAAWWTVLIAAVATAILWTGRLQLIQYLLTGLVALMSCVFVICMVLVRPDWYAALQGLCVPRWQPESLMLVLGLLGTTVVPYNLFLHSRSAMEQWYANDQSADDIAEKLRQSRRDTVVSISLGGLITGAILITAAGAFFQQGIALENLPQIAEQLRPLLGESSQVVFCLGLVAAGLTSAVTAPLAAGFVAAGCFGWSNRLDDWRTRAVMLTIMLIGVLVLWLAEGASPDQIILVAQVANGLILPVVAVFLVITMNRPKIPARFRNKWLANLLGVFVILVVSLIAMQKLAGAKAILERMLTQPAVQQHQR